MKIRGFRIELGEIEAALRALPGVRDAAVVRPRRRPGDRGWSRYVVTPARPAACDPPALRGGLRPTLPDYMVPAAFVAARRGCR